MFGSGAEPDVHELQLLHWRIGRQLREPGGGEDRVHGGLVNIRKFTGVAFRDLGELVGRGTLTGQAAAFLRSCVRARLSIVFAGAPGVQALTHVLVGAVDEAALYIAQATDPSAARTDMDHVLRRLTLALTVPNWPSTPALGCPRRAGAADAVDVPCSPWRPRSC